MPELLAPAGDLSKLKTAVYYGADSVYFGGDFSLRAYAGNFTNEDIKGGLDYLHSHNKKGFITVNIFPKNSDFEKISESLKFLESVNADGVIISDAGLLDLCKKAAPKLKIHLSTQANTLNKYSAKFWSDYVDRIILARELSLTEIKEIRDFIPDKCSLEAFIHGAMCISYSGRCLLSDYLTGRESNKGQCVQACRWEYKIREVSRSDDNLLSLQEDDRGTYILNSKDLNMIEHLSELKDAGVESFKIEGRMKSEYYVGTVVNAYRKAIDTVLKNKKNLSLEELKNELYKTGHREYTTAYYLGENNSTICYSSSKPVQEYDFIALVLGYENGCIKVQQRNRFFKGDILEILSPGKNFNKEIKVEEILDEHGNEVTDARVVQQVLFIKSNIKLNYLDMLRKRKSDT